MPRCLLPLLAVVALVSLAARLPAQPGGPDFDRQVAPLLVQHCLDCHSGPKPKGGLDLSNRKSALAGGKSGAVIVPGKPEDSLLRQYVDDDKMPPKKPLDAAGKEVLRAWSA